MNTSIEQRRLGKTNLNVSVLGLGAAEFGFESTPVSTVERLVASALDAGLNVIDTAECYKDSEEKVGRALAGRRSSCFLFSKCGHAARFPSGLLTRALNKLVARPLTGRNRLGFNDWDRRTLERSLEYSLQFLRTDYLDVLQLHSCPEEVLRRGEVIEILQRARQSGKTRFIGYSGDGEAALYAAQCGAFDTLQLSLNIADQRAIERTVPEAAGRDMGIIAKRPIANAVWRNAARPENSYHHVYWDRVQALQYDFLADPASSFGKALRFTLSVPGVHTAIVGTTNPDRWKQNAGALAAGPLPPGEFTSIRSRWNQTADASWVEQF